MYRVPIVGEKFGELTILDFSKSGNGWITTCKCDCGKTISIQFFKLYSKHVVRCSKHIKLPDIGQKFTNLTVIDNAVKNNTLYNIRCICDCGKIYLANKYHLFKGSVKSCGCKLSYKKKPNDIASHEIFQVYKSKAKERKIEFQLTEQEALELCAQNCHYCGVPPATKYSRKKIGSTYMYNGIDRVDSKQGYCPTNVVPCCTICNWMKNKFTLEEFLNKIKLIYERHICLHTH